MIVLEVEGADPLADVRALLDLRAAEIVAFAAEEIAARARGRASGTLAAAVQIEADDAGAVVRVAAHHAAFVEFGTSRMSARPFLMPAVEELRGRLLEVVT